MKVLIDSSLEDKQLYKDLRKLIDESEYEDSLNKLPDPREYIISYLEKLWDYLDNRPKDDAIRIYALNEIYFHKGTTKIFHLLEKWYKVIEVKEWQYDGNKLSVTLNVSYVGNNPQLLQKLVREYFEFLLLYSKLELVYDKFRHTIEIKNTVNSSYHALPYINIKVDIV